MKIKCHVLYPHPPLHPALTIVTMLVVVLSLLFSPLLLGVTFAQQAEKKTDDYNVLKTNRNERFVLPYSASNTDRKHPIIYKYENSISNNWILTIQNNMSYAARMDAKTIIKLVEPAPSEKYIEIAMFSDVNKKFWAAVNTPEVGYDRIYERNNDGWSRDEPVIIAQANNQGLTITNGKRIIIDKLAINGFTIGSISVYGKDDTESSFNTFAGNISFDAMFGNPAESPLYYVPLAVLLGVGSLVTGLIITKKRQDV
jgi:hypothetical protein